MTVTRSTSRGSASATAALNRRTACEPPKISRTRSPGPMSRRRRAASRSTLGQIPDRRAGHEARPTGGGRRQRPTRRLERDRDAGRETSGRPDRPARDHVAVPQHDRDAQGRGRQQDRHRDVSAGGEDRGGALPGRGSRPPAGPTARGGADPARHGRRRSRRPQRAGREAGQRNPGGRHERCLQAPVAAQPAELRRVRSCAQRSRDGECRVDVSARPAARDQQSHRRSMSPSPRSRARSTAGSRPPRN